MPQALGQVEAVAAGSQIKEPRLGLGSSRDCPPCQPGEMRVLTSTTGTAQAAPEPAPSPPQPAAKGSQRPHRRLASGRPLHGDRALDPGTSAWEASVHLYKVLRLATANL